ncbi:protein cramped-like [Octopus sinensis]|uniref:Protein cramped-like n=1 Tax=Octopus sinensis TaxID=2607531 RepID=A0A6P7TCA3_9MOLL|nr:protein cramped-like [Octopus sinensis]
MGIGTRSKSHQGECLGQDQASSRVSIDGEKGTVKGATNCNEGYHHHTTPGSNNTATALNTNVGSVSASDKRPTKLSKSDQHHHQTQIADDGTGGSAGESLASAAGGGGGGAGHNCTTTTTSTTSSSTSSISTASNNGIIAFTFTRTRGIKRPKREQRPPGSPAKKVAKEVKTATPEAKKRQWELWTVDEKSTFFQALNECGRDFDAIQNNFAQKYKKKGALAMMIKNKEQVRHFYYRTWNKISKYIEMKDGIKKHALEVYGLIHYGEMRKRLGGMRADKNLHKLNEFIQEGSTLIKIRRKSFRIRTPYCNALKKINNVEDPVEDEDSTCRVPERVTLELNPKNNSAWFHVQEMAQNPRLRMTLKSDQHLSTVMSFLQKKWKPPRLKLKESLNSFDESQKQLVLYPHRSSKCYPVSLQAIETAPKPDLKLSNYYTNIKAHKARIMPTVSTNNENSCDAAFVQSPKLSSENAKDDGILSGSFIKESDGPVTVSGTTDFADVSSDNAMFPDTMMSHSSSNVSENSSQPVLNSAENKTLEMSPQVSEKNDENKSAVTSCNTSHTTTVTSNSSSVAPNTTDIRTSEDLEKIKIKLLEQSKKGWTMKEAENLTVAQLFLIFGKDEPIRLEYDWSKTSPDSKDKLYESYSIINRLRRLVHLATMEFTDYVKVKAPKSNEKPKSGKANSAGCEVCEACGKLLNPSDAKTNSKFVNKNINRNACLQNNTKNGAIYKESCGNSENAVKRSHDKKEQKTEEKNDDSERVDGVFRVPVIPGKGPLPQTFVTNEYINKYRPTRYRRKLLHSAQKPVFFQRTLLPKENPHMMTLTLLPSATPVTVDASFLPVNNRTSTVIPTRDVSSLSNTYTTQVLTQPIVSTLSVHNQTVL